MAQRARARRFNGRLSEVSIAPQKSGFPSGAAVLIAVAALAIFCLGARAATPQPAVPSSGVTLASAIDRANAYYQSRENLDNLRKAISILQQHVASDSRDYEAWWRIAEYDCYLGRRLPHSQKKPVIEQGVIAGQKAETLQPNRPEGHFWTGVDEGLLADASGLFGGLELIDPIRNEMQTVLKIDPDYLQDGAERVLGRLYYRIPFFKGGDDQRSVQLLESCLRRYPRNSLTMLYLADSYRAVGRIEDARRMLEGILHLSPVLNDGPELAENQTAARQELEKYFHASL